MTMMRDDDDDDDDDDDEWIDDEVVELQGDFFEYDLTLDSVLSEGIKDITMESFVEIFFCWHQLYLAHHW